MRDDVPMTRRLAILMAMAALSLVPSAQASPGDADPSTDASFFDALTKAGFTIQSQPNAVKSAKAACGMMDQGRPEIDVVQLVNRQNPGLDTIRAAQFTAIATSAYCPQHLQRAVQPPAEPPVPTPAG